MTGEELAYGFAAFAVTAFMIVCAWLAWEGRRQEPPPP